MYLILILSRKKLRRPVLDRNAAEYIRVKRKQYLFFMSVIAIFGLVLFLFSRFRETEPFGTYVENRGMTDLYGRISASADQAPLKKRENLLESPKFIPYRIEGDRLILEKPFSFQGRKIENATFRIKYHGNTIFSEGFSSSVPEILCRGTAKKGTEKFMIS